MISQVEKMMKWGAAAVAAAAALTLSGCGMGAINANSTSGIAMGTISGTVHGGQQPVSGARVYLLAVGTSGYGTGNNANPLLANPGYVTTDAGGNFSISGLYTCPANSQVYLLSLGGNPGLAAGTNNGAIILTAGLGSCSALTSSTRVTINEVSTAAMAYALAGFSSNYVQISASSTNATGMANAFAAIPNIISVASGGALTVTPGGNGIPAYRKLNTLADVIAPCVNSNGNDGNCAALFSAATPPGGSAPSDTFGALLSIVQNPGNNVTQLYNLVNASAPFQPTTTAAPYDWLMYVSYTGSGINQPYGIAIDGNNNVWVTNQGSNSITELNNLGVGQLNYTSTTTMTTSQTAINMPTGVAVDTNNFVYFANTGNNNVFKVGGPSVITSETGGGMSSPAFLGIDGNNSVYVANQGNNTLSVYNSSTNAVTGPYSAGSGISNPSGVAVDNTGQVFIASAGNSSIAKFNPASFIFYSTSGATGGGLTTPAGLAFDGTGTIYLPNTTGTISVFNNTPAANSSSPYAGTANGVQNGVAIDGLKKIYTTSASGAINVVTNAGTAISPSGGFKVGGAQLANPTKIGLDMSGNLWIANNGGPTNNVTEVIGMGAPTIVPIAVGVKNGTLGTRP